MSKSKGQALTVPFIFIGIFVFLILYLIEVYPAERADILNPDLQSGESVSIELGQFIPDEIKIDKGQRVTWWNRDNVPHRVNFVDSTSQLLYPGGSWSKKFEDKGTFTYVDPITELSGTVIVD